MRTARLLMTLSIVLLVVLQVYWLRNAWFDEHRRLQRELGVLLRESVLREEMKAFIQTRAPAREGNRPDTGKDEKRRFTFLQKTLGDTTTTAAIDIFVSPDSAAPIPQRIFSFERERQQRRAPDTRSVVVTFPMPVGKSSLSTVEANYRRALKEAGIHLSFIIKKNPADSLQSAGGRPALNLRHRDDDKTNRVRFFTSDVIEARFDNPFMILLKRIQWQLIFALVMIVVTTLAFIFLYRSLLQQQKLAELKNDFIANITHELKTPISTVSVAIEALKNFDAIKDAQRTKEYLDISGNELQRLNLLVDKVLKLSLLGKQQIVLQKENLSMELLLQEVLTSMKLQFGKQEAKVNLNTSGTNFTVQGDRLHLLSVLYNLLDNALKYSPEAPEIAVTLEETQKMIVLQVRDNGIGIAPANQSRIFEKFFRVPQGNTHNIKGYGLGLSYVQEVMQAHDGTIRVQSSEGAGSTFTVTLPKADTSLAQTNQ